jgi:diguanylate cyclase (GGDEF)-like protein
MLGQLWGPRVEAATDRTRAAADRAVAAAERDEAVRVRAEAVRARAESAGILKLASTDELTGAWTRKFGLELISRELERAQRTNAQLLLAFVDVDGLKLVNDGHGHQAGDALLKLVGETLHANMRRYDLIVRYGGDEFVCAMPNLTAAEGRARFAAIAATLTAVNPVFSVTFGLAEAGADESLSDLIGRADAELLKDQHPRRSPASDGPVGPLLQSPSPTIEFRAGGKRFAIYVVKGSGLLDPG